MEALPRQKNQESRRAFGEIFSLTGKGAAAILGPEGLFQGEVQILTGGIVRELARPAGMGAIPIPTV